MSVQLDRALIRDPFTWPLRLMIAVIVCIAGMGLFASWVLVLGAANMDRGLSGQMTVELPPGDSGRVEPARLAALVRDLKTVPDVAAAAALSDAKIAELLAPWLGKGADLTALPLPRLVDVQLADSALSAPATLTAMLARKYPEARISDHHIWVEQLAHAVQRAALFLLAVVLALFAALCGTVMFACRAGLAVHQPVVELLHTIGAPDSHICRQMRRYAGRLVLPAGFIGLATAALAAAAMATGLRDVQLDFMAADADVFWAGAGALAASLPLIALGFAALGAQLATRRILLTMP